MFSQVGNKPEHGLLVIGCREVIETSFNNHSLPILIGVLHDNNIKSDHISRFIKRLHNVLKLSILFLLFDDRIGIIRIITEP